MQTAIEIIKNRSDIGAGTRGADLGIDAMEIAAINKGSDFFHKYPFIDVPTRNASVYEEDRHPYAKYINHIYEQCYEVASVVELCIFKQRFPLVFSGDHSSAIGTISGIKAAFPDKVLGVVWIDAHADIHSPYTTPSGNMHGMPLGAILNEDNLSHKVNDVDLETAEYWTKLKGLKVREAKITADHLVYFGVRDTESPEDALIEKLSIRNYMVGEVRSRGVEVCVKEALLQLEACDIIYVSFDVDSMDSELISDGTGTPVPRGFFPQEISALLDGLKSSGKVCCLEIVEVNPLLDNHGNRMAEVAYSILEQHFRD